MYSIFASGDRSFQQEYHQRRGQVPGITYQRRRMRIFRYSDSGNLLTRDDHLGKSLFHDHPVGDRGQTASACRRTSPVSDMTAGTGDQSPTRSRPQCRPIQIAISAILLNFSPALQNAGGSRMIRSNCRFSTRRSRTTSDVAGCSRRRDHSTADLRCQLSSLRLIDGSPIAPPAGRKR